MLFLDDRTTVEGLNIPAQPLPKSSLLIDNGIFEGDWSHAAW